MSCSAGPSYTPDDIEKWSMNVNLVLDSPRGRRKFKEFLSEWKLEDDEVTLQFWEKCNAVLLAASQNKHLKKHDKSSKIHHARFTKEAMELVEFSEEYVNLDVAQLREFRQTVEKHDVQQIIKVISRAQRSATDLLRSKFELFRKDIQKELPPLKPKKKL
ncbi:hypothetical protein U1Q18_051055 [Sarracenia purpurea var. burkii]